MNARDFFETVAEMRKWQKRFFRTHTQEALDESKRLEGIIDDEITRVRAVIQDRQEPKLF